MSDFLAALPQPITDRARAVFWLQVASLAATGWVIVKTAFVPAGARSLLPVTIVLALWFSLAALAVGGVITFLLLLAMRRIERADALNVTLRTSAAGVWFAPAVMLLGAHSPFALTAALALVVSVTRVLYSQWRLAPKSPVEDLPPEAPRIFTGELPQGFLPRDFWPAFLTASAVQAGYISSNFDKPSLAGIFYALAAGLLTAYAMAAGVWTRDRNPTLPRSILGVVVTLMLAVLIVTIGVHMRGTGFGGGDSDGGGSLDARAVRNQPPPPPKLDRAAMHKADPPPIDPARLGPAVSVPGGVPGVILWPPTRQVPLLVEPLPKGRTIGAGEASRPFIIPFAGSYWMFRFGFYRPPANSVVERGTPTETSFKTVDAWPLEMEAHQRLDREMDLSCCRQIRVEVLNADQRPSSITVELAVIDRAGPPRRIGFASIRSSADLTQKPVRPVAETLEFSVPPEGPVFDEFDVIFHRDRFRGDRSARISIERFALVPK